MTDTTATFVSCARDAIKRLVPVVVSAAGSPSATISTKRDGSLVTTTDTLVEAELKRELSSVLPGIPILGEEGAIDCLQVTNSRSDDAYATFFETHLQIIVDPIDGTRNFVAGRSAYCIAAALTESVETGIWPVASVVAIPAEQMLVWSDGQKVYSEHLISGDVAELRRSNASPPSLSVNSRDRAWLAAEGFSLNLPWVSSGSSVYDLIGCALGRLRGSVVGSQRLWDLMAPLGIACCLDMVLIDIRSGEEITCIVKSDLSQELDVRPWGLERRMVLVARGLALQELLVHRKVIA